MGLVGNSSVNVYEMKKTVLCDFDRPLIICILVPLRTSAMDISLWILQ